MATIADITFTGADEDPTTQLTIRTGGIRRVSNLAANSTASVFSVAYDDANSYPDDQESTIYVSDVGGRDFGPAVRVSASGAYFLQNVGGANIFVNYWNGGGFAEVGNVPGTYTAGKTYTLRVEGGPSSIDLKVYEDGVQLGSTITTTTWLLTSGKAGMSGYDGTWRVSRFIGADLSAAVSLEQEGFRWGNDDGSESAHTWAAAQDANITAASGQTRLINVIVNATGTPGAKAFKLQYRKVGDSTWRDVPLDS